jgi:hypothetical protein
MRHPFETWPASHRRAAFLGVAAVSIVVWLLLAWINADIRTDAAPNGQVSLQMAGSAEAATRIVGSWQAEGVMHKIGLSVGFDYVFMVAYGLALAAGCAALAVRCRVRNRSGLAGLGAAAAWGVWIAAGLDAVENALMVPILSDPGSGAPGAVKAFALGKFALLIAAVVFLVVAGVATSGRRPTLFRSTALSG